MLVVRLLQVLEFPREMKKMGIRDSLCWFGMYNLLVKKLKLLFHNFPTGSLNNIIYSVLCSYLKCLISVMILQFSLWKSYLEDDHYGFVWHINIKAFSPNHMGKGIDVDYLFWQFPFSTIWCLLPLALITYDRCCHLSLNCLRKIVSSS